MDPTAAGAPIDQGPSGVPTLPGRIRSAPIAAWSVPIGELPQAAEMGVQYVVARFSQSSDIAAYLSAARRVGLHVIAGFPVANPSAGSVQPDRVAAWVALVRGDPTVSAYLSAVEPGSHGFDVQELRSLYSAFKRADPSRPVLVSFGKLSILGQPGNTLAPGVADIVIAEWYPVVFPYWRYPDGWSTDTDAVLAAARATIQKLAPGTAVWLSVQCHEYIPGNRRRPTADEVVRQVRAGFRDLGAVGLVFYPWRGSVYYASDLERNPALRVRVQQIVADLRAGRIGP